MTTHIKAGTYTNELPSEAYHGDKCSISRSALLDFDKSPYYYYAKHLDPNRPVIQPTPAMMLGTAFHSRILEPDKFYETYDFEPEKVLLKDVKREKYDGYKEACAKLQNSKKIILNAKDTATLDSMTKRLLNHSKCVDLLCGTIKEQSFFWIDEHTHIMLKSRPDAYSDQAIIDLKTCTDASPRAFQTAMYTGGYHIQGAMVRDGIQTLEGKTINTVINICVETKWPYSIGIYIIDELALDVGKQKYKDLLLQLKHAVTYNEFKDYEPQVIGLPRWAT